jgi:hypothetical protein
MKEMQMCTVLVVRDPDETTKKEWDDTMFPALSEEEYVSGRFAARVYGLKWLQRYAEVEDGTDAAVLLSTQCHIAVETACAMHGDFGVKLMVRLGMGTSVPFTRTAAVQSDHGTLPEVEEGRKHAFYCLIVDDGYLPFFVIDLMINKISGVEEIVRIFREDGGQFLGGIGDTSLIYRMLGIENSDQYIIKTTVASHEEGLRNFARLRTMQGVITPVAFIEN